MIVKLLTEHHLEFLSLKGGYRGSYESRGVPAYTQSTQLRTLIFECPKNKNVLNREKCNKNMPHPG